MAVVDGCLGEAEFLEVGDKGAHELGDLSHEVVFVVHRVVVGVDVVDGIHEGVHGVGIAKRRHPNNFKINDNVSVCHCLPNIIIPTGI